MRARHALPALTAVAALMLTGCVDNSETGTSGATAKTSAVDVKKDGAVAALLPAKVATAGKLVIATSPNYTPNEYKDAAGKPIGWDIELGEAIAAKFGLKAEYQVAKFDNIIPGILGGKIDIGASSFTDNPKREKQVDFVNYYLAGVQWASATGKVVDPANACGLKVAVQATTFQDTDEVPDKSAACVKAGKADIKKLPFDTQDAAANAVALGQADAFSADTPVSLYAISQLKGKIQAAGKTFDAAPYGMAVAKDSGMAKAVQAALQSLVDDGSYAKILNKWGVADGGIQQITINAGAQG
jgi:polar amino acid transport system substrate-binding protein